MIIGVPREIRPHEHRVGLSPISVGQLTRWGHAVVVEKDAGHDARFSDENYQRRGAQIVYDKEEAWRRADIVCQVGEIKVEELELLRHGSVVCGFHHLAVAPQEKLARLIDLEMTLIGYEIISDLKGYLPVLYPFSRMAGQLAIQVAAQCHQNESGGRGVLMGSVCGVPPARVIILGGGTVGQAAAAYAIAIGLDVVVLDADLKRLRRVWEYFHGQVQTVMADHDRLGRYVASADVLLGAVLVPGGRSPLVVSEEMVKSMKPGSVIVDVSIDQGGCIATSRPTTLDAPTYVAHDVIHYCVPNLTANIARTASEGLSNAALPFLREMADQGVDAALRADPTLANGVYMYKGILTNKRVEQACGIPAMTLEEAMQQKGNPL